jgi:hypothetical protein
MLSFKRNPKSKSRLMAMVQEAMAVCSGEDRSLRQNDYDLTTPFVSLTHISAGLPNTIDPVTPQSLGRVLVDPTSLPKTSIIIGTPAAIYDVTTGDETMNPQNLPTIIL